ncbi:hypothetical protein [Fuerstiella marisgermanici]|uniref:Secreted protein n=1 Tax=Fuerstiella marisgermanici TaxID=1891926 RepID=A0A1P8WGQ1_9PLAN|nr:hypothetical protein [Fuerstiella marisgermanici]APZ93259.1 hypothetical protein Fuma_02876 [Fuerstiella marisgermanici]
MYQLAKHSVVAVVMLSCVATFGSPAANAGMRSSTGWRPYGGPVQWKVQQYDCHYGPGTEIRYYFQNNTSNSVTVTGRFRYTSTEGQTRYEEFKVTVKPRSKRGGAWDGRVFFTNHSNNWKLLEFRYTN